MLRRSLGVMMMMMMMWWFWGLLRCLWSLGRGSMRWVVLLIAVGGIGQKKKGLTKCSESKKGSAKKDADVVVNHGKKDEAFEAAMMSDLRHELEKIASEMGTVYICEEAEPVSVAKESKKRKRENKGVVEQGDRDAAESSLLPGPSSEKSSKRVRFSLKNNVVWKPHCPLPPQDLRLPPSATPRGSALKKGIPAGPVRGELSCQSRKRKKKVKPNNTRKGVKTIKKLK